MKKSSLSLVIVASLIIIMGGSANASVKTYHSKAAFLADLSALVFINPQGLNFEAQTAGDLIPNTGDIDGITFIYSIFSDQIKVDDVFDTTSPDNYIGLDNTEGAFIYGDSFALNFDQTINAIGLYVIAEPESVLENDFELITSAGSAFNSDTPDASLSDGDAFFIGLIETDPGAGFTSATLSATLDPALVNYVFNVDDIISLQKQLPLSAILLLLLLD